MIYEDTFYLIIPGFFRGMSMGLSVVVLAMALLILAVWFMPKVPHLVEWFLDDNPEKTLESEEPSSRRGLRSLRSDIDRHIYARRGVLISLQVATTTLVIVTAWVVSPLAMVVVVPVAREAVVDWNYDKFQEWTDAHGATLRPEEAETAIREMLQREMFRDAPPIATGWLPRLDDTIRLSKTIRLEYQEEQRVWELLGPQ